MDGKILHIKGLSPSLGSSKAINFSESIPNGDISGYLSINNMVNNRNDYVGFHDIIISNSYNNYSEKYGKYIFEYFEIEVLSSAPNGTGLFICL